ncbi:MAG: hypothetical protein WA705_11800 [Candidatus Ozemobacteraceae bacterium]
MTNLFNHEEVARISRETIEHSLRFFDSINERLIEITKDVRPDMPLPRTIEEMNKVCEKYQSEHRAFVTRTEKVWRETFEHINDPKNRKADDAKIDPFKNLFDPNEILRLNRDVMNTTVSFFSKTGENLFKALDPRQPMTTPNEMIDLINKTRDEYERRHRELTLHIENILRGAFDPSHKSETRDHHTTTEKARETCETRETRDEKRHSADRTDERRFDLQSMIRLNREVIDNTVKSFLNLNESLLKITSHNDKTDILRKNLEVLNRSCEEYRKTHQTLTETILNTTRETMEKTFKNRDTKMNPLTTIFNREEMFKLNQETLANTVKFFLNLNDELVRTIREPGRPVNLDTQIEEYQRIHRILTNRIETVWHETLDRLNKIQKDTHPTDTHAHNNQTHVHSAKEPRNDRDHHNVETHVEETAATTPRRTCTSATTTGNTTDTTTRKPRGETKTTKNTRK